MMSNVMIAGNIAWIDIDVDIEVVLQQVRLTGQQLKQQFQSLAPVTETGPLFAAFKRIDGAAADDLRQRLAQLYPAIAWFDGEPGGELDDSIPLPAGDCWLCDVIDGAVQYLRAIPQWCTALTLLRDGEPQLVVIYDAMHEELFHAVAATAGMANMANVSGGAFRNGLPITVNARSSFHEGILASSQPPFAFRYPQALQQAGQSLSAVLEHAIAVRNLGPTALQMAYVACGRLDGFWVYGPDGYNCTGPALLVREAGGTVSTAEGSPYGLRSLSLLAAPAGVHASMLAALQPVADTA
jgi:myo-inositol-1(or 4)-monophosphatase